MLDKARAGSPSVSVSADRSFGSNFSELLAKDMMETIKAGQAAVPRVDAARRVLDLLQKQPITGTGATFMANLQGAMAQAGLLSGDRQQQLEATQALVTELASQTLAAIRTSGLGAGQGFTNTDREFLEKASGGKIDMTAAQLERIATLNARAGLAAIQAANNAIQRARQMPGYSDQNFPLRELPVPNLPKVINW